MPHSAESSSRLIWIVCAVVLDGFAAVFGAALRESFILKWKDHFLSAAAGVMLGVAFVEILPEALANGFSGLSAGATLLGGFFLFYAAERAFSQEVSEHGAEQLIHPEGTAHSTLGPSLLFGDALHNITDGVAVATAFLSNINIGVALALAVFFHELPHETGDYAVLIAHGYSRKRALLWMFLVQMSALIGAVGIYFMAGMIMGLIPWLLAFSAGGLIYIAASKLLPATMQSPASRGTGRLQLTVLFTGGILLAAALRALFGA